jgi:hypothetical protein
MVRFVLLLVCSVMVTACGSTPRSYEYASWETMDYAGGAGSSSSE